MTGVILGIVLAGLAFIAKWDRRLPMDGRAWAWTVVCALLEGAALREAAGDKPSALVLALAVTGGSLLLACVTDVLTCQVYNFTWWPALAAGAVSLGSARTVVIVSLAVFWVLLLGLFGRMYGRADCYAFCVCGVVEAALGMGMEGFLGHMLLAWMFLALVQGAGGNIGRRGRLKKPVPFLPYITVAFWVSVFLEGIWERPCSFG